MILQTVNRSLSQFVYEHNTVPLPGPCSLCRSQDALPHIKGGLVFFQPCIRSWDFYLFHPHLPTVQPIY